MKTLSIVLEDDESEIDPTIFGEALFEALAELDDLAKKLGMQPLSQFISPSPDAEVYGSEDEVPEFLEIEEFPAEPALMTVRALSAKIASDPDCIPFADEVVEDLTDCERILTEARDINMHWHFEVDDWDEEDLAEEEE